MSVSLLTPGQAPVTPGQGSSLSRIDTPDEEGARRQAEWERQIESLDQREFELHQTQLRLIRGQMATVIHDINALRQDVANLDADQRANYAELSAAVGSSTKELAATQGKVTGLERQSATREEFTTLRSSLRDFQALVPQLSELQTSVATEQQLRKNAESSLKSLSNQIAEHADSMSKLEIALNTERSGRDYQHGSLGDRLAKIEKDLGGSLAKSVAACEVGVQELKETLGCTGSLANAPQRSLAGRLAVVEEACSGSAERGEIERTGKKLLELQKTVAEHTSQLTQHATVQERIDRTVDEVSGKQVDELRAMSAKVEQLMGRVASCERSGAAVGELQKASTGLASEAASCKGQLAAASERLGRLEGDVGGSLGLMEALRADVLRHETMQQRYAKDVEAIKVAQAAFGTYGERLGQLEGGAGEKAEYSSVAGKMEQLGGRIAACEKQGASLCDLKRAQAAAAAERAALETQQAALLERLSQLEAELEDLPSQQTAAMGRMEHLQGRIAACERHGFQLGDISKAQTGLASDVSHCTASYAALKETMEDLAGTLGPLCDAHARDIQELRAVSAKIASDAKAHSAKVGDALNEHRDARDQHQSTIQERVDYLEGICNDSGDKHERFIKALEAQKVTHAKLIQEVRSREGAHAAVLDRLGSVEGFAERLESLEASVAGAAGAAAQGARDLEGVRAAQVKLAGEVRARDASQQSGPSVDDHFAERVSDLEQAVQNLANGDIQDLHALQATAISQAKELEALKKAGKELKAVPEAHKALSERLDAAERAHRDSASELVEILRKEQDARGAQYTSQGERLRTVESRLTNTEARARREAEELKRLWEALDTHTHDLAGQILDTDRSKHEVQIALSESRVVVPTRAQGRGGADSVPKPEPVHTVLAVPTATPSGSAAIVDHRSVSRSSSAMRSMVSGHSAAGVAGQVFAAGQYYQVPASQAAGYATQGAVAHQMVRVGSSQGFASPPAGYRQGLATSGLAVSGLAAPTGLSTSASLSSLQACSTKTGSTKLFDQFDVDGSGHLTREEFSRLLQHMGKES